MTTKTEALVANLGYDYDLEEVKRELLKIDHVFYHESTGRFILLVDRVYLDFKKVAHLNPLRNKKVRKILHKFMFGNDDFNSTNKFFYFQRQISGERLHLTFFKDMNTEIEVEASGMFLGKPLDDYCQEAKKNGSYNALLAFLTTGLVVVNHENLVIGMKFIPPWLISACEELGLRIAAAKEEIERVCESLFKLQEQRPPAN